MAKSRLKRAKSRVLWGYPPRPFPEKIGFDRHPIFPTLNLGVDFNLCIVFSGLATLFSLMSRTYNFFKSYI